MKHYYISDNTQPRGFVELSETEYYSLMGDETTRPYANALYRGNITVDKVPEEIRETVQSIVANKIARFGEYNSQQISSADFHSMIEEVL